MSELPSVPTYSPATDARNFWISRLVFSCELMQAHSATATSATAPDEIQRCIRFISRAPLPIISAPLCLITRAEREQFFQQLGITHARGLRRLREVLVRGEVRIRIRLDHVDLPVGVHAVVEARASRETEAAIDAARQLVEAR